ncbi:MAG: hypothetical protein K8R56_03650, partial [Candidatus Eisenbacteria bacterium]|nr:hypothetical protein [Candidatus Eisenbacteria bacterium]
MRLLRIALLAFALGTAAYLFIARPQLPPAERGRRLAGSQGCFTCHGAAGLKGAANPGRKDRTVPT